MKRQIIKTKPVAPYRVARIVIAIVVVLLLAALAYLEFRPRQHTARQDSAIFLRNPQIPTDLLS